MLGALSDEKSGQYCHRQSVGQSFLVSGTHLGPATNLHPFQFDYFLDSLGIVDVGRPLWREVGSVLFSFCRASPAQRFSDLSPTGLMSIVYWLYFLGSPNLEGQGNQVIPQCIASFKSQLKFWILSIECICMFHLVLRKTVYISLNSINRFLLYGGDITCLISRKVRCLAIGTVS
jgi:hypothetical protein